MGLAQKISALRAEQKWSYSDLARVSGIPQPTIWRLEKGSIEHPKADTLMALANAFKVPIDYLVQDDYQINATDLLRTDDDLRTIVETYSLLSQEDRQTVKKITQSFKPRTPVEEKQRYVDVFTKLRRVLKE